MKNLKIKALLLFLLTSLLFGQVSEPVSCGLSQWSRVVGTVVLGDGECDYEVGDWEAPDFLELNIGTVPELLGGVRHFHFINNFSDMVLELPGEFRSFEVLAPNGETLISIEYSWDSDPRGEIILSTYAYVAQWDGISQSSSLVNVGFAQFTEGEDLFDLQILWMPGNAGYGDGWIEFLINGTSFARREGVVYGANGFLEPGIVRYGSTVTPLWKPKGAFKFRIGNPRPHAYHY